jgi:hypothetical protein
MAEAGDETPSGAGLVDTEHPSPQPRRILSVPGPGLRPAKLLPYEIPSSDGTPSSHRVAVVPQVREVGVKVSPSFVR